ncbi:D-sedoheptulose 7-phosphate isomerase [Marivirga sp. S37H4]|uniref:Phosphoheptose isomerase n=1 Tax=Marivirga aurantiaca TaxID=2802615 RepID=A0A934WYT8_9BACT|nr:D-sedoheptulose 7-phosphate isomerase [Marivirga aurantiaca]MBK6265698.1 D-sedoheptulose 7-phosphate isomerase [Marivirga aurantiaca]
MISTIKQELEEAQKVLTQFLNDDANLLAIEKAAKVLVHSLKDGGKIMSCGNGGSHCDAMHFAEELSGRFRDNRPALAAMAISDVSHISCVGNDYGFQYIFSRSVEALGKPNDVLLAISTSGNSQNILEATNAARLLGMQVIALTGKDGGELAKNCDVEIRVPHFGYADRIQEIHIKIIHILILQIEKQLAYAS